MPVIYTYQDTAVLKKIAPELIQTKANEDPIFKYFPITEHRQSKLRFTVKDNYRGVMNLRGYDGAPTRVLRPGETLNEILPGVYGEFAQLDEQELTERAKNFPADQTVKADVSDLVNDCRTLLTVRQVARMRQIMWTYATTHVLNVALPTGGIGHYETFAGQTMTVSVLWSNLTTSTPLSDLRQAQLVYGRGTSNNFMAQAEAWMNLKTAQYIMNNRNNADVGGIRAEFGNTVFQSIEKFNEVLLSQGAPKVMIYEDGYQIDVPGAAPGSNPGNQYQMFLPDGVVWIVAKRPGNELPGEFMMTMHMVDGGGTQPYAMVKDFSSGPLASVPPSIQYHQGFNGGPAQERPSQTLTMIVA